MLPVWGGVHIGSRIVNLDQFALASDGSVIVHTLKQFCFNIFKLSLESFGSSLCMIPVSINHPVSRDLSTSLEAENGIDRISLSTKLVSETLLQCAQRTYKFRGLEDRRGSKRL